MVLELKIYSLFIDLNNLHGWQSILGIIRNKEAKQKT